MIKNKVLTLPQLRRAYIEAGHKDGKAENTLRNQDNSLKKLEGIFGAITLDELDADAARGFVDLIDRNVADGTISGSTRAGYIRDVKSAFNWAVAEGIVSKNPFDGIRQEIKTHNRTSTRKRRSVTRDTAARRRRSSSRVSINTRSSRGGLGTTCPLAPFPTAHEAAKKWSFVCLVDG